MTRIGFTISLVVFLSIPLVDRATAQSAVDCNQKYEACRSSCNGKNSLDERYVCQGGCEGGVQGCLTGAAVAAEMRARDLKAKAIEERKKITCTPAQGNVQRCVQHGKDLLPPEAHFKGGDALVCNNQYDACRRNCNSKYNSYDERSLCQAGCEGGVVGCLRGAAVAAEMRARDLKAKAIEERKKITCTPAQGNVQRCVQHGKDLLN